MNESDILQIEADRLSDDAVRGLLQDFVLREGTDYGHQDWSLEDKMDQVKRQLLDGRAYILFDRRSERCEIVTAHEYEQLR